ncbi:hypothetical protein TRFO_38270 [Tritrichomonas foetus]|uniref:Uncharacterized protein n=1 Tax=Tritrichomonas foetus TaxID=1144522 RepID=A0A1J4JAA8_9EUKA|nr:hypothetical protein TRFO_38270 [Tritrichomonas foetus]|eukprot:OHS95609.1 hypothetical protein TRFO_38270 [Tritrichomonas foetus]
MYHINIAGIIDDSLFVSPFDSLQNALNRLGLSHCYVVYNGSLLSTALSFSFYNIKGNDTIYLVDNKNVRPTIPSSYKNTRSLCNDNKSSYGRAFQRRSCEKPRPLHQGMVNKLRKAFNEKYGNRLRDPDTAFNMMKCSVDPTSAREAARVNDLFRQRIETNPSSFRKISAKFEKLQCSGKLGIQQFPTVLPEKAIEPSTEFLPIFPMAVETATMN